RRSRRPAKAALPARRRRQAADLLCPATQGRLVKLPFLSTEYAIEALTLDDAEQLPAIHEEDFVRPWSANEFESLLGQDTVFGFAAWKVGNRKGMPAGFVLARLVAGEGEILTIAVARSHRRRGLGRDLMEAVLRTLHAERAEALFLEVDETNA